MRDRAGALAWVVVAYAAALVVGLIAGASGSYDHPLAVAAVADVAATVVVFAFSLAFRNSSFYDPYWSVAPLPLALYWIWSATGADPVTGRQVLVVLLVTAWGARLTYNWLRGWHGLEHEDWRYVDLREKSGRAYWLVSFLGIHMFPTLIVFAGCLSIYVAVAAGNRPLGALDLTAFAVTAGAIWLEARADRELADFRRSAPPKEAVLASGVWSWSRHPNYFGEMGFWWGMYLFALAAAPQTWTSTAIGPVLITLMFRFISLPMIEQRMQSRRPSFAAHAERTSMVVPWPPRSRT